MAIINGRGRVGIRRPSVIVTPSIVFDGLKLYLDAGKTASYPGTGTTWTDISGNGYNATLAGPSGGYPSYNGSNGIGFDGVDDYGSIPYTIQSQFTNKISINVWVKPTWFDSGNNDGVVIIGKTLPTITSPYTIFALSITPAGKYGVSIGNGVNRVICTSTNTVSLNAWVNLCMVYDGATIKLYKNGIQDPTTAAATYTLGQNTVPLTIGSFQTLAPYYDWFKGNMCVIQLYNKGLSDAEVTQNYKAIVGNFYLQVSDTDAQAFIYAANLNSAQASAVNTLVTSMKAAGIWTKMKAVYPMVGGSAASHKWNLKDTRDVDAAFRLQFYGGVNHNGNGIQFNGTNGGAYTYFNPYLHQAKSNLHLSLYTRKRPTRYTYASDIYTTTTYHPAGWVNLMATSNSDGSEFFSTSNNAGGAAALASTAVGFSIGSRTSATSIKYYKNTNSASGSGTNSEDYANSQLTLNGNSGQGTNSYSAGEYAFASMGDGLTDAEAANYYTIVQAFQTSLGRQV